METVVDINASNAKALLVDESFIRPVLVDFWASWCAPCKTLGPILERLAAEYQGAFLLAKVDAESERMIASQFGVQSLPTLVVMKNGQPVDGFTGAQPEAEVRKLLERHLPKPWDILLAQAQELMAGGEVASASSLLRTAYGDSNRRPDIAVILANALITLKRLEEAKQILDAVRLADRDAGYQQVLAAWELASSAQKAPEIAELEKQHQQRPEDVSVAHLLAVQYSQHGYSSEALELLLKLLSADINALEGVVKRTYTDILATLGKGDPLAVAYQRKLYALLY